MPTLHFLAGTAQFSAQKLRIIFVIERRSATAVNGPYEVAMGNNMWCITDYSEGVGRGDE